MQPGLSQLPRRVKDGGGGASDSSVFGRMPTVLVIEFIPAGDRSVAILPSALGAAG